jgi:hypothetical protein
VRRAFREPAFLLVAAAVLGGGCSREAPGEEERQRLLALGYVDYATGQARPGESGVVLHDAARAWPGYNLYASRRLCTARLVDNEGRLVQEWSAEPCGRWANVRLLPGGDLVVIGWDSFPETRSARERARYLARFDREGRLVWRSRLPVHHDLAALPDGHLLVLTARLRQVPAIDLALPVREDLLTLVSPGGVPLRSWSLYDMLLSSADAPRLRALEPVSVGGEREIDLLHANSVQPLPTGGAGAASPPAPRQALVTFRNQDLVALFDLEEERLLWSWGPGMVEGPHYARRLESGSLLLFDNGILRRWSRALEIDPDSGAVVWEYRRDPPEELFSSSRGSVQRLPNGNTLITASDSGEAFEVTAAGELVWRFFNPDTDAEGRRASMFSLLRYDRRLVEEAFGSAGW